MCGRCGTGIILQVVRRECSDGEAVVLRQQQEEVSLINSTIWRPIVTHCLPCPEAPVMK